MPRADVVALTRRLVAIDATNPSLVPGGAGERELAEVIGAWLDERGFDVRLIGADPARPSVLARRRGTGGGRTLLLAGHLDTVGGKGEGTGTGTDAVSTAASGDPGDAGVSAVPGVPGVPGFAAVSAAPLDGDRIVGRGAYDMAGGLAAAMVAAAAAPAGLAGDLVLAFAADEEFGSVGMEELLAAIDAEAEASVDPYAAPRCRRRARADRPRGDARPPRVRLVPRRIRGPRRARIAARTRGRRDRAGRSTGSWRCAGSRPSSMPARDIRCSAAGSVRVSTIDGGTDAATVADRCVIVVERRTLPGEADPGAELERVLAPSRPARIVRLVARPAMEADADAPIARAVLAAVERATGAPAVRRGDPWWTDAGLIADAGIPVVLVGPVGGGAHADDEWVSVGSLETLVGALEGVIRAICDENGP